MVARLKLKEIDGRAPQGVNHNADSAPSTSFTHPGFMVPRKSFLTVDIGEPTSKYVSFLRKIRSPFPLGRVQRLNEAVKLTGVRDGLNNQPLPGEFR